MLLAQIKAENNLYKIKKQNKKKIMYLICQHNNSLKTLNKQQFNQVVLTKQVINKGIHL